MNRFLFLIMLMVLAGLSGCGMLGSEEPKFPDKTEKVAEEASIPDDNLVEPSAEEVEVIKDEQHRQEIEEQEKKIDEMIVEQQELDTEKTATNEAASELEAEETNEATEKTNEEEFIPDLTVDEDQEPVEEVSSDPEPISRRSFSFNDGEIKSPIMFN